MRIVELRLHNWLRYRGEHRLVLEPTVYGVEARWARDVERSNWGGKTALLTAIPFCLFGWHQAATEDEWITQGEPLGGVSLVLEGGVQVDRTRRRGKSTQLVVTLADGSGCAGAQAQQVLQERLGIGQEDYFATCHFRQRQIAGLVTARPAERQEVVGAWLQLAPLDGAEARVRQRLGACLAEQERVRAQLVLLQGQVEELLGRHGVVDLVGLEQRVVGLQQELEQVRRQEEQVQRRVEAAVARQRDLADLEEYERLGQELEALDRSTGVGQLEPGPAEAEVEAADQASRQAEQQALQARQQASYRRQLLTGGFDGQCPVSPGFVCPAQGEIRARGQEAAAEYDRADAAAKQLGAVAAQARGHHGELVRQQRQQRQALLQVEREQAAQQARWREVERQRARLAAAAQRVQAGAVVDVQGLQQQAQAAHQRVQAVGVELAVAQQAVQQLGRQAGQVQDLDRQVQDLDRQVGTAREALAVLRRARRQVAEGTLGRIEAAANAALGEAQIGLALSLRWERATKGLAPACGECGQQYPPGRATKQCLRCGAERGPKLEEKLQLELSDRSGAAEDLGGLALALAASQWLRGSRQAPWAVCCLDEPFGALDARHRQALGAHVATLLRQGFRQALVVAHQRDALEALPGRIVITAGDRGSRVVVEV